MSFEVEHIRAPQKLYRNVKCSGCDAPLKPVFTDRDDGAWTHLQPDNALILLMDGGYSMAIDPCGDASESDLTIILCEKCIPKMCEQWPCIGRVVQVHISSSLGHDCAKEKKFVWRNSKCCDIHCPQCKSWAANDRIWETIPDEENPGYTKNVLHGPYHRWNIKCKKCEFQGPSVWAWEMEPQPARQYILIHVVDGVDDDYPHKECKDPSCCSCDCDGCKESWVKAGKPNPLDCSVHRNNI